MAFDLEKFNKQVYTTMTETVDQDIAKFNEASGYAIELVNEPSQGDFSIKASFKQISGLVRRRNVNSQDTVQATRLKQLLEVAVKVAAGTPPVEFEKAQYEWVKQNPALAALTIGEQLAKARLADMLNAALSCAVAALTNNKDVVTDLSTEKASFRALNKAASKFGDRSNSLRAWAMHSSVVHALYDNALTNGEHLFSYDSVNVSRDPFGKLLVVTDSDALIKSQEDGTYNVIGLVEQAIAVADNNDFNAELVATTGKENIQYTYQAEWSYNAGILGYSWDTTKGASPTDAALATPENWKKHATSNKDTAGVLLIVADALEDSGLDGGLGD